MAAMPNEQIPLKARLQQVQDELLQRAGSTEVRFVANDTIHVPKPPRVAPIR